MRKKKKHIIFFLTFLFCIVLFSKISVCACEKGIECHNIFEEIVSNYIRYQYRIRGISYCKLEIKSSKDMYNNENEIVGKIIFVKRDYEIDYVVLNLATNQIDEFVLCSCDAENKFSDDIYYTGVLDYYKKEGASYKHIINNEELSAIEFNKKAEKINKKLKANSKILSNKVTCDGNILPNPSKTGYNGFYSWSKIYNFNIENNYSNSNFGYLSGIDWNDNDDSDLKFYDQDEFNDFFNTQRSCGPTALTNMFSWFQYMEYENSKGEVNALKNGSPFDTFARFKTLVNQTNEGSNSSTYNGALKKYAKEQGYKKYKLIKDIDTFSEICENIDNNIPILASIRLDENGWGGHALLIVGYEEFSQRYEKTHSFLWFNWTESGYHYSRYLRVIDGWSSSNKSRYIDMTGYWDSIIGRGFTLCEDEY